jgi:hypothetical protein
VTTKRPRGWSNRLRVPSLAMAAWLVRQRDTVALHRQHRHPRSRVSQMSRQDRRSARSRAAHLSAQFISVRNSSQCAIHLSAQCRADAKALTGAGPVIDHSAKYRSQPLRRLQAQSVRHLPVQFRQLTVTVTRSISNKKRDRCRSQGANYRSRSHDGWRRRRAADGLQHGGSRLMRQCIGHRGGILLWCPQTRRFSRPALRRSPLS